MFIFQTRVSKFLGNLGYEGYRKNKISVQYLLKHAYLAKKALEHGV